MACEENPFEGFYLKERGKVECCRTFMKFEVGRTGPMMQLRFPLCLAEVTIISVGVFNLYIVMLMDDSSTCLRP